VKLCLQRHVTDRHPINETYICEKVRVEGLSVFDYHKAPELYSIINVRTNGTEKRFLHTGLSVCDIKGKGKGEVAPITGHEGPEREQRYSSTLPLTSALYGGG